MARLRVGIYGDDGSGEEEEKNEEGEEEFPCLGALLGIPVQGAMRSRVVERKGGRKGLESSSEGGLDGAKVDGENDGEENVDTEKVKKASRREISKTGMKKKRVLKSRNDNPLLRPLGPLSKTTTGKQKPTKLVDETSGRGQEGSRREKIPRQSPVDASLLLGNVKAGGKACLGYEVENLLPELSSCVGGRKKGGKVLKEILLEDLVGRKTQGMVSEDLDIEPVGLNVTEKGKQLPKQSYDAPVKSTADISTSPPPENVATTKPRTRKKSKTIIPETPTHLEWVDEEEDARQSLDDDDDDDDDDDGLSDFIVDDSEILTEEDSVSDIPELPPPRSVRRLVKGRRPRVSDEVGLEMGMKNLGLRDDLSDPFEKDIKNSEDYTRTRPERTSKSTKEAKTKIPPPEPSSDLDDPFTLRYSPSPIKPTHHTTPPSSPLKYKPGGLPSPKKISRIPTTPHRPSTDAFWCQDVINDWNDEFSPLKKMLEPSKTKPPQKSFFKNSALTSQPSPRKTDKEKKAEKKAFSNIKHALASSFLTELDETITNGDIANLSKSTGGVKIIWSNKLSTTAGRANWKRETLKSTSSEGKISISYRHHASIELAEKVIDCEERLINVIAHEFCHLANFMVSGIKTNPHGKEFQAWGRKVSGAFGGRGVVVTTKHSYEIEYRYFWECEVCGMGFGRHSKSIDVVRHRCGVCKGLLVQTRPAVRKGKEGGEGGKGMGEYQKFVKENLKGIRGEEAFRGSPQKEIMGEVGRRFREFKAKKVSARKEGVSVEVKEVGSKEGTPIPDVDTDEVENVARKLDFLDLTSP